MTLKINLYPIDRACGGGGKEAMNKNNNKYSIYTANWSAENKNSWYKIKYFKIKKKTVVHSKKRGKTNIYNKKGVKKMK